MPQWEARHRRWSISGLDPDTPVVPLHSAEECGRWQIVLLSDEEREAFAFMIERAQEARETIVVRERRRVWWRTWYGVGAAFLGTLAVVSDIVANIIRALR